MYKQNISKIRLKSLLGPVKDKKFFHCLGTTSIAMDGNFQEN